MHVDKSIMKTFEHKIHIIVYQNPYHLTFGKAMAVLYYLLLTIIMPIRFFRCNKLSSVAHLFSERRV